MSRWIWLSSLVLLLPLTIHAQPLPPDTLWTYTYASSANDEAWAIAPTLDGGFVVGGQGLAPDSSGVCALLIRLDCSGHQRWVRYFGVGYPGIESIANTEDGGFAVTGGRCENSWHLSVVKCDSDGNEQWYHCFNYLYLEEGVSIAATADGGFAALSAGSYTAFPDIDLVRLNSDGDSLWSRAYGGAAEDHGGAVLALENGDLFVAGSQNHQAWVFKTDSVGEIQWSTTFGSPTLSERIYAAAKMPNGDYVVVGTQTREDWTFNPYAACVSSAGDTLWTRTFDGYGPAYLYSIAVLSENRIVLGGRIGTASRNGDYFAMLLNSAGDTVWSAPYGTDDTEYGRAICPTSDGGIAMAGFRTPDLLNYEDIWVVRTGPITSQVAERFTLPPSSFGLSCYPNPFNATTTISYSLPKPGQVTVRVYDITGREVKTLVDANLDAGGHNIAIDGSNFASGIYFVRMQAGTVSQTKKIVLLK